MGYDAGLRKGDIIMEMNHQPMTSSDQAVAAGDKIEKNRAHPAACLEQGQNGIPCAEAEGII